MDRAFLLFSPLLISLDASTFSWDRSGRRARGSLQRAATARTADRKTRQNVRCHDLYRSNASMIKQKKTEPAKLSRIRREALEVSISVTYQAADRTGHQTT